MVNVAPECVRPRSIVVLTVIGLSVSACTGGGEVVVADPTPTTAVATTLTTADSTTSTVGEVTTETTVEAALAPSTTLAEAVELLEPEENWQELASRFRVTGVETTDTLNVRDAPGLEGEILTALSHDTTGLVLYNEISNDGSRDWVPVQLVGPDGSIGAGWVAVSFIQAVPSAVRTEGIPDSIASVAALEIIGELSDRSALAGRVGPDGVLFSSDGFVDVDNDVVLSASELASDTGTRVWGVQDGTGDPVESTIAEFLASLAATGAITATEVIGHDVIVGRGNTIVNTAEVYPDAKIVEFHNTGTELYGGLDWTSVRVVLDTSGPEPVLLALIADSWTI